MDEIYTKEEASLKHKGKLLSSKVSDSNDNDDDDDDKTNAKDSTCYGDCHGAGGGDSSGAGEDFTEWIRFLSPSVLSETLGATEKDKASSMSKYRKPKVGKQ